MSREIQVLRWCDGDHEEAVRAEVERTVSVDGAKPILLDLCLPCDKVFEDLAWLMMRGVEADQVLTEKPPRKKPEKPEEKAARLPGRDEWPEAARTCQERRCIDRRTGKQYVAPTRSALGQHAKQRHGKLLSDYDWAAREEEGTDG